MVLAQPLQQFHTLTGAAAPAAAAAYNDPLYDLQTNLTALGIARAHARTQGQGLKVALIDTAVDANHPDLRGRIVRSHSYLPEGTSAGTSLRHGTAMAGIIAAVANNHIGIVGIAPQAQIEVFAACWQQAPDADAASCNTFTLAQALAGAIASGRPAGEPEHRRSPRPAAHRAGAARSEQGGDLRGRLPGRGARLPDRHRWGHRRRQHRPGAACRACSRAPGEHVMTLRPQGQYDFASGTSVSAAELTGVIALLMSAARHAPEAGADRRRS